MPRPCSVCRHPERRSIDLALIEAEPFRNLAKRYGLSSTALYRHREAHLSARLAKAYEAEAGTLLDQVSALQERAMSILAKAEADRDLRAALAAIREARGNLELLAKLLVPAPIDIPWERLSEADLERIAAGEDPRLVLRTVEIVPFKGPSE